MTTILGTVGIIAALGLVGAIVLIVVSRATAVEEDSRLAYLNEILPGVNCGSCGYASCEAYAKAIIAGEAKPNCCTVGGEAVAENIAKFLGVDSEGVVQKKAFVACQGTSNHIDPNFVFEGVQSCRAFSTMMYTSLSCPYGCLGYGDCAKVCPFDAITMDNGTAVINQEACTGCGKCIDVCPRNVIHMAELAPGNNQHPFTVSVVRCNNPMKGKDVKSVCDIGCIGCKRCEKSCPEQAITVENNLAVINTSKCNGCGKCIEVCPTSVIDALIFP